MSSEKSKSARNNSWNPDDLPDLLAVYYRRLFPYKPYTKWLSYAQKPSDSFSNREFAFILKDDVYLRYRSYRDALEFEKDVQSHTPYKIDIGAVFTNTPKDHKKQPGFQPVERELVFDIDLTDYDDIRTCCSFATYFFLLLHLIGGGICTKCWRFMVVAVRVLDAALRDDFAFTHILWLFSGRRGVHCWVADEKARKLTNTQRSKVADYLTLIMGSDKLTKKVSLDTNQTRLHHSVQRAYDIITQVDHSAASTLNAAQLGPERKTDLFELLCLEQGWLDTPESINSILNLCADQDMRDTLRDDMERQKTPKARLRALRLRFDPTTYGRDVDSKNFTTPISYNPTPVIPSFSWSSNGSICPCGFIRSPLSENYASLAEIFGLLDNHTIDTLADDAFYVTRERIDKYQYATATMDFRESFGAFLNVDRATRSSSDPVDSFLQLYTPWILIPILLLHVLYKLLKWNRVQQLVVRIAARPSNLFDKAIGHAKSQTGRRKIIEDSKKGRKLLLHVVLDVAIALTLALFSSSMAANKLVPQESASFTNFDQMIEAVEAHAVRLAINRETAVYERIRTSQELSYVRLRQALEHNEPLDSKDYQAILATDRNLFVLTREGRISGCNYRFVPMPELGQLPVKMMFSPHTATELIEAFDQVVIQNDARIEWINIQKHKKIEFEEQINNQCGREDDIVTTVDMVQMNQLFMVVIVAYLMALGYFVVEKIHFSYVV